MKVLRIVSYGFSFCLFILTQTAGAGLVAHYAFDGNANDSSGNGLHGTVNGATLATDRFGQSNSAYSFNGNGNHILVSDSPLFAFGQNPYSISFWFNLNDTSTYQPFIGQWGDGHNERSFLAHYNYDNNGHIRLHEEDGVNFNYSDLPHVISSGEWHQMSIVRELTGNTKIYLDALYIGSVANRFTIQDAVSPLFIGKDPNVSQSYSGLLDDIRIYDSALSENEIGDSYNGTNISEPGNYALMLLGLLSLGVFRRDRRSH